jgi:hypothetical protein
MELLGEDAQVEAHFNPFGDSANLDEVHSLRRTYHRLENHFGRTRGNYSMTTLEWKLVLVRLAIVLILMQDRCMVCAERTIGLGIILDTPGGTPR